MEASERELRQRFEADPSDAEALRELARMIGCARDRKREAVALWRRYVELCDASDRAQALFSLAAAQVEAKQETDAIETLGRCTALAPDRAEAFDLLGELLRRAGRLEEAVEALRRAADLDPDAVRPRLALVIACDALDRGADARAALESLAPLAAKNPALEALVRELMRRRS